VTMREGQDRFHLIASPSPTRDKEGRQAGSECSRHQNQHYHRSAVGYAYGMKPNIGVECG